MPQMRLKVNGHTRAVDLSDPSMPLLWVLRDELGLTGTKYGCGIGQCGACTVHIDGSAARSCSVPVSGVGNREVTTIEALSHPLQQAWEQFDVPQCGYCQAGQLMTACAFLKTTPRPTDDEIRTAMSGNLCRCGTYPRIEQAIKHVVAGA